MKRTIRSWSPLALGILLFAAASYAGEQPERVSFDGTDTATVETPKIKFIPSRPAAAVPQAKAPRTRQSGADLFYFTPAEAEEGRKRFGIRLRSLSPKGYVFDSDVPADIQQQMRDDLAFIGGIQGSGATPLHQRIFGKVDGPGYVQFFESRVTGIGMSDCGSSNAVACVIPFMDPSKMWLTQNYIKFSHPQVARMMVVFHESRHTESYNGNWPHATCPDPFRDAKGNDMKSIWTGAMLARQPACDETPLGSYGSSTIMLKNIQKFCANCNDKVKMDAGLYADDQINRIIDSSARREMEDDLYK